MATGRPLLRLKSLPVRGHPQAVGFKVGEDFAYEPNRMRIAVRPEFATRWEASVSIRGIEHHPPRLGP